MRKTINKRQEAEEALTRAASTALRAIGQQPTTVTFGPPKPAAEKDTDADSVHIPWRLDPHQPAESIALLRAAADTAAFEKRYSNPALAKKLRPADPRAALIYDALERARYESCGTDDFPGGGRNVQTSILNEAVRAPYTPRPGNNEHHLAQALYFAARRAMTGMEPPAHYAAAVESVQDAVEALHDPALLASLPAAMRDQEEYARRVRTLLKNYLDIEMPEEEPDNGEGDKESKNGNEKGNGASGQETGEGHDECESEGNAEGEGSRYEAPEGRADNRYRPYTRAFDETIRVRDIKISPRTLQELRDSVADDISRVNKAVIPLAARLRRQLMAQEQSPLRFEQDLEDGILDTTRLTRLITDPFNATICKRERETEDKGTVVSLLLDNSGSMRGYPVILSMLSAQLLAETIERCGIKTEILGFTTKNWKGGEARLQWLADGKPPRPGRINDLLHIVYKGADEKMRHARDNLLYMLQGDLLKENIDGEALQWAHARLLARPEKRKILIVISDGAPQDDSTIAANGASVLDNHLREVVSDIEKGGRVELSAIGIRHDVRKYYKNGINIMQVDDLGPTMIAEAARLFITDERLRARYRKGPETRSPA